MTESAQAASQPQHAPVTRETLYKAAISCPHDIDANRVILKFDAKQAGPNALAQLADRLAASIPSLLASNESTSVPSLPAVRLFHVGAQNDAWYITSGKAPASTNDFPDHDADRTCVAHVYDEGEARRLVGAANQFLLSGEAHHHPAAYEPPKGYALVPVNMTQAMQDVLASPDWEWSDVLVAASGRSLAEFDLVLDNEIGEIQDLGATLEEEAGLLSEDDPLIASHMVQAAEWLGKLLTARNAVPFQPRVEAWMVSCFGADAAFDKFDRRNRFMEESVEMFQSCGGTHGELLKLADYVFGRPQGEPHKEAGAVMLTLAGLSRAYGISMHKAGDVELRRAWAKKSAIRAKHDARSAGSPLPGQVV